jgi:transcriptional activator of cad operon
MRLLLCLAGRPGEVVSVGELLNQVWPDVAVSPDSVYQAVTSLRRVLGDDSRQPTYIATVPRLGYRMVAPVSPWPVSPGPDKSGMPDPLEEPASAPLASAAAPAYGIRRQHRFTGSFFGWVAGAAIGLVLLALAIVFLLHRSERSAPPSRESAIAQQLAAPVASIAVLPFLDLTEGMKEEEFADGMTEELIGRFSKIPGLRVPSPTSSFYFKGKQVPVADIAKALGVVYVLDGSVRKSGVRVRVAARLIRADNGYVVWSETYDRPLHDILMVQDDIAGEVTKALRASLHAVPRH